MRSEASDVIVGDSMEARRWVEASELPEETKVSLLRFIVRFSTLTFYKDSIGALDAVEEAQGVVLPRWLRAICQTIRSVEPECRVWARFDHSVHPYIVGERLRDSWYRIGVIGYVANVERPLFESLPDLHLLPIGDDERPGRSTLAINLSDHTDQRVYEYALEDLQQEMGDGEAVRELIFPMFASYANMLGQITAVKIRSSDSSRRIIEAQE